MKKALALAGATLTAALVSGMPAHADTLNVQGVVAPYCNITLTNVSSGTVSIAFTDTQKVANLRVACNAASGTKVTRDPSNGDLLSSNNVDRINYAMTLKSPSDPAFNIAETDTAPGGANNIGKFTRSHVGYSQAIASGIPLELWLNVNVQGEPQPDFSTPNVFHADAAPAGTYTESFDFSVTQV